MMPAFVVFFDFHGVYFPSIVNFQPLNIMLICQKIDFSNSTKNRVEEKISEQVFCFFGQQSRLFRKVCLFQSCHFYNQYIVFCLVKKKQIFDIGFLCENVLFFLMGYQALDYSILYHKQCAEFSTPYVCRRVLYNGKHLEHLIQVRFQIDNPTILFFLGTLW